MMLRYKRYVASTEPPDAHGRAYLAARKHHQSLNAWATEVLEKAANEEAAA